MKPRGVILDFDGVVADSLPVHLAAWEGAVQRLFKRSIEEPRLLAGRGTRAIAGILATRFGDPSLAGDLARVKHEILLGGAKALPLLPGAAAFVAALKVRRIPFGVATNAAKGFVGPALAAAGLAIDVVVARDDVARGKPAPDVFFACANAMGIPPAARAEILVFDDSPHGIEGAVTAAMTAVGVTSVVDAASLKTAGAVATCADLADALAHGWLDDFPP